jgi:class 3 adenylate cyclase/tetratricopeptide (TPR) repeat protein
MMLELHGSAAELHALWRHRTEWLADPDFVRAFVESAIKAGELLLAFDAARFALEGNLAGDLELTQQMALALAQMGSTARAQEILEEALQKNPSDRTTLSGLGRTCKDLWCAQPGNTNALARAFEFYNRAFEVEPRDYYPGINAAAVAVLRGDLNNGRRIAAEVLNLCHDLPPDKRDTYWVRATIAEALAILGRREEAESAYTCAGRTAGAQLRELSTTRKQARLLAAHLYDAADVFDSAFPIPKLIIFSGHMIDAPDRKVKRFQPIQESKIRSDSERAISDMNAGIGFASMASGSDILFLEAMLDRGATINVVLPWPREEFIQTSVAPAGAGWIERFHNAWDRAASRRILGQPNMPASPVGFEYCNLAMIGIAREHARSLDLDVVPLVVWDRMPGAPGGTGSFAQYWRSHGFSVRRIPLPSQPTPPQEEPAEQANEDGSFSDDKFEVWVRATGRQEVKAIMFADIVGYSRIPEAHIPRFVAQFNQRVSKLIAESPFAPINLNTWGDGFFFVFSGVEQAARFALDLRDLVSNTDWVALGLPHQLSIRIGLHAGPVYVNFDPVVRQLTFTGAHVNRAARIEPVAAAGQIFASEEFAALAAAEEVKGFECDFVGTTELAKSFGYFRIFSVDRMQVTQG